MQNPKYRLVLSPMHCISNLKTISQGIGRSSEFSDFSKTPGDQVQKSKSLKFCTWIDFMMFYKFAKNYESKIWTEEMLFSFIIFFSIFLNISGPLLAKTEIPEIVHPNRFHGLLQVCNSLCKWIMNREDFMRTFLNFSLFSTIRSPRGRFHRRGVILALALGLT